MSYSKILFMDLDGTLLDDDWRVSYKNREAIQRALNAGNYVVAATGRSVESGRLVVKDLGLTMPGCYMIAFNGAVLYDCSADRVLYAKTIQVQYVYQLFERAHRAGLYIHTYNQTDVLAEKHTKELDYYIRHSKMSYKLQPDLAMALENEPHKVMVINLQSKKVLEDFQAANSGWSEGKLTSFLSSNKYLEYCPFGISKGVSIEYLCGFLNIPIEHTIAVGDEKNDVPMIKAANIGIAMKNGVQEVKDMADYITENDNNHDAIAEVISKFIFNEDN